MQSRVLDFITGCWLNKYVDCFRRTTLAGRSNRPNNNNIITPRGAYPQGTLPRSTMGRWRLPWWGMDPLRQTRRVCKTLKFRTVQLKCLDLIEKVTVTLYWEFYYYIVKPNFFLPKITLAYNEPNLEVSTKSTSRWRRFFRGNLSLEFPQAVRPKKVMRQKRLLTGFAVNGDSLFQGAFFELY